MKGPSRPGRAGAATWRRGVIPWIEQRTLDPAHERGLPGNLATSLTEHVRSQNALYSPCRRPSIKLNYQVPREGFWTRLRPGNQLLTSGRPLLLPRRFDEHATPLQTAWKDEFGEDFRIWLWSIPCETLIVYSAGSLSSDKTAGYGYVTHRNGLTYLDECSIALVQALATTHGAVEVRRRPGHTNTAGNEQADALVKAATSLPQLAPLSQQSLICAGLPGKSSETLLKPGGTPLHPTRIATASEAYHRLPTRPRAPTTNGPPPARSPVQSWRLRRLP
ncbi:hypothetical protein Purlil1_13483 [Purpureocillium lilacinum]|uniref:RNase H type-1 domain-containing protein n=1 Tax=Purpureocillium lilacinum TaxID=33203 RepID=A0ABR0BDU8_PURLI|nr:hypothetical protein Purlil1_13483 [Purpureocillium lilacinum]